jgi:predicted anti-sigma-YlaC factor YlaD
MSDLECAMAPMVEARRDGRLDGREAASIERHLVGCAACRSLAEDLERLAGLSRRPSVPERSALEHQRGRGELLRAAAGSHAPASVRRPPVGRRLAPLAAAALAALALIAGVGAWRRSAPVASARHVPSPPQLALRTETTVQGSPGARFDRVREGSTTRVALAEGELDLSVAPLAAGERFLVVTGDAEVEVRGTIFHVEAHEDRLAAVAVSEGKVEVRTAGAHTLVPAGGSWRAPAPVVAPAPPPALPSAPAPPPVTVATPARGPAPRVRSRPVAAAPQPEAQRDPGAAFSEGVALIGRGDYAAGAEKLAQFSQQSPADGRAEDAAFLAVVALQRAGRPDAAAEAARRYLARYPSGYRRAEAEAIAAGAARP